MNANVSISIAAMYALGNIILNRWLYLRLYIIDPKLNKPVSSHFDGPVFHMLLNSDMPKDAYSLWFKRCLLSSRLMLAAYPLVLFWSVLVTI